jgi:nitrogen fixation/metabolism regulation signal transduction histidine kinase
LFVRIACYFLFYQLAVWFLVIVDRNIHDTLSDMLGSETALIIFVSLAGLVVLLGLFAIYEAIIFTHRVVGPIVRFRKTVQAIIAGEEVDLVRLRNGDFLLELRDEFNEMLRILEQRGAVTLKPTETAAKQPDAVAV